MDPLEKIVIDSHEGGEGNTSSSPPNKQPCARCFYALTFYNYENSYQKIQERIQEISKKGVLGKEVCPSTGNLHLQGYIVLKKPMRPSALKLPCNPHIEACKGSEEQNLAYCKKDNDYWIFGFPKPIKILEKLYDWQLKIEQLYLDNIDDRKIFWFHEAKGNIGKSAFCKYMVVKHKLLFCSGGKYADIMNLVFNQDMDNCRGVIFDIPRSHKGNISYASLESIKNGMVCNTKYETGVKIFNSPHIFIFANFPPDSPEEISADRWVIEDLDPPVIEPVIETPKEPDRCPRGPLPAGATPWGPLARSGTARPGPDKADANTFFALRGKK